MSKKKKAPDNSAKIHQRDKIRDLIQIREFPWTPRQQQLIDLILNKETKIVFVEGPAGTAKTLIAVYAGLRLLNEKKVSEILYVRTIIESASKGLGSLPGESCQKFEPFLMPFRDKLDELLSAADANNLVNDNRVRGIPVNYLRGASTNTAFFHADESQNFTFKELVTLITRIGNFSRMVLTGDTAQSDLNGKSGLRPMIDLFDNPESKDNGIHVFRLDKSDIMRSGVVKFIVERLEKYKEINDSFKNSV